MTELLYFGTCVAGQIIPAASKIGRRMSRALSKVMLIAPCQQEHKRQASLCLNSFTVGGWLATSPTVVVFASLTNRPAYL